MRAVFRILWGTLLGVAMLGLVGYLYVRTTGLSALPEPGPVETQLARAIRGLAVPSDFKSRRNPVAASPEAVTRGMRHFARYCALCHRNDGSGRQAAIGRGLFPRPPDMRAPATQNLTDGELFYIIEYGVRFTGMPAFGSGEADPAGEELAWQLVHFIRHLPRITTEELDRMEAENPL